MAFWGKLYIGNYSESQECGKPWKGGTELGAVTIGMIVYYMNPNGQVRHGEIAKEHERRHLGQAVVLGPMYPVASALDLVLWGLPTLPSEDKVPTPFMDATRPGPGVIRVKRRK